MWSKEVSCTIINYSKNFINIEVMDPMKGVWRLTLFYGLPGSGQRKQSWDLLRHLKPPVNYPWCIIGDFNDILAANEKIGNHDRLTWMINGFRDAVLGCNLIDIPLGGHSFTWFKSLGTDRAVEEKLDRAMANGDWLSAYPDASLSNLVASVSDHSPILLNTEEFIVPRRRGYNFRFENSWLYEEGY